MNKQEAKIGLKVHPIGRGYDVRYIVEIGEQCAGISADKNAKTGYAVLYSKLVKFKNQE